MNPSAGGTSPFPLFLCSYLFLALFGLPHLCLGHGYEFLSARLELPVETSVIDLKISAAYGANPMLPDATAAIKALKEVLCLQHSGKIHRLTDLAPMKIEQSTSVEGTLPPSLIHADDGLDHQFMIGHWRWTPDVSEIAFTVPKGSLHDVLLWRQPPGEPMKSILLLSGDVSQPISLNPPRKNQFLFWISLAALSALGFLCYRRKQRPIS